MSKYINVPVVDCEKEILIMFMDLSDKTCLIIDDFADMRGMLKSMISTYGIKEIDTASNGKEAIKQLERRDYDIVLCDYNLGDGKDGQQILEEAKLKDLIRFSAVFIMITAENTMQMVMGAFEYLPDDYLSKPFNKDLLRARLEKVINNKADFEEIEKAISKDKLHNAISLCDERIQENPRNLTEFYKLKSSLCVKLGKYKDAAEIFEKILAKRDTPWAKLGLGKIHFYSGELFEAKEIFEEIVEENSHHTEAYDWLAKTMVELGDMEEAQEVLETAIEKSPKAILRLMDLGEVAMKNKDFKTAERAYKKASNIGRNSIYQQPTNYTNQAKALGHLGSGKDAMKVLARVRKDYAHEDEASMFAAATESFVYKTMGNETDARKAYEKAEDFYGKLGKKVTSEAAIEMAATCLLNGETEKGVSLMQEVIKNNHEDQKLLHEVQKIFDEAGMEDQGKKVISSTREEIIKLNNKGVRLAEEGDLEEAIDYFEKAVKNMPSNKTVNMNMAKVLLLHMRKNGKNDRQLYKVRQYIQRIQQIDPANKSLQKLSDMYESIAGR